MRNRRTASGNWPVSTPRGWTGRRCPSPRLRSGSAPSGCSGALWTLQPEGTAGSGSQGEPLGVRRAAPGAPCCGGCCPAGQGRQGGSVCRDVPGTQADCMMCCRRCRAHGPLEIFRNRISPVPRGCVSTCICACRWRYSGGCFPPDHGLRGQAELARVPHLSQLPCGHASCHPLLQHSSS